MSHLAPWLAARIVEHLREAGERPGAHIAEQKLADHFRVSRTPIRQALALLAESKAVERRPNRGYFLALAPEAVEERARDSEDDEESLYYRIAEDRLTRVIDERVTEMALVRRYGATRARIRALLSRMAQEGWVVRLPGHGWSFEPAIASVEGYESSFRFRSVIEPAALRQPGYRLSPEAIASLRARQQELLSGGASRLPPAEIFEIGATFHEALVGGSGNPFLLDAMRRVNALRRLIEYRTKRSRETLVRQCREHLQLLELIEKGKLERAARLLEDHLGTARESKAKLVAGKAP